MKRDQSFVPSSETESSKKRIVKKVLSTFLTTLAVVVATLLFGAVDGKAPLERLTIVGAETDNESVINIPLGLSRRRGAFNKAIDMIADAAAVNPRLADYYSNVTTRVKGRSADGENSSGVRVVKSARKISRSVSDNVAPGSQTAPDGLAALAHSVATLAQGVSGPDHEATSSYSNFSDNSESEDEAQQFTVGDMAFDTNPAIEHWVNYYAATPGGRRTMMIGIGRSNSYLEMARAEFRSAGVPEDLVWLAFVESVWNPRAVSPAAAGGIWQFIPATATDYGLTVQSGNDERADPFKQTRVAATYLRDLYTIFGDWALAMAAYNSGEPRVMGAIVKNGRANFWDLYDKQLLPKETRDYVPKILAAIKVAGQAENYGLTPVAQTASGS